MTNLLALAELESIEAELVPEILPVDARLAVSGPVAVFATLFERAAAVAPTKVLIAGTGYALLEAVSGGPGVLAHVRLGATDGAMSTSMVASGVEVIMAGAVLLPGKRISEILKLAPTTSVRIEVLGNTATLRSGRAQWTVQTPPGEALPPAADTSGIITHPLPVAGLLEALTTARKAASLSSSRASLMQLSVLGGAITGLDGARLHRQHVEGLPASIDLSIPLRAAEEVCHLLRTTTDEVVEMGGNASHLVFRIGSNTLVAQRALVNFPNIESQVLGPALTNPYALTLDRAALTDAIRRVRVNADPDFRAIFLTLTPGRQVGEVIDWSLTLSARDRSGNSARESLNALWSGPAKARELCVHHVYLSDLLAVQRGADVVFKIGEDSKDVRLPLFIEDTVSGFTGYVQQMRPGYLG